MILQLFFNGFISGLMLALVAVGFNIVNQTCKVFHMAHGAIYVSVAYSVFFLFQLIKPINIFSFLFILFCSLLVLFLLIYLLEFLIYRPMMRLKSGQAITLIASMGVYTLLINVLALLFSNETKTITLNLGNSLYFYGLIITSIQLVQLLLSGFLLGFLIWYSQTKGFLKIKALMSNELVAALIGVNIIRIRVLVLFFASFLAGSASVLRLFDTGIDPNSGMSITLTAAVAVIIGGEGSILGTIFASIIIAFLQTYTELFFSAQWKDGITFLLLLLVILWKTEGILSHKMRVEQK